ncbi:RNA 2'-phosphotransferase [Solibacillus sp. R5-41]|uniref:RNA 2'-phosphotransferase n=1 Tax=Solibacillus sp. R5-41 TaxID=2048654 RepID=UPI000C126FE6|nr:RNA 2'-phosphotransferase [Solibacillus sp. R5-41]ATP38761.1 RNA 2'-phosphotransferase [Solibacillus sp. R5-41]
MTVSIGFYKKIYNWIMSEAKNEVIYRPFILDGNPYKSRLFLVGSNAIPFFKVEQGSEKGFADALLNRDLMEDLYNSEVQHAPREFKGSLHFAKWLQKELNETAVYTSLNTYQVESADELKEVKKENPEAFARGQVIFDEVLNEFQPEIIVLQGTAALNQFKAMYAEQLVIYNSTITKVQHLEAEGAFAEMLDHNGKKVHIFATRSMSYFGKDGSKFECFKNKICEILDN